MTLESALDELLDHIQGFQEAYELIKDNPKKLLNAAKSASASECTRVHDECAQAMEIFGKAEEALKAKALGFLQLLSACNIKERYALSSARWNDFRAALTAIRYMVVSIEFLFSSLATKSHDASGPEVDRFFKTRDELLSWKRSAGSGNAQETQSQPKEDL